MNHTGKEEAKKSYPFPQTSEVSAFLTGNTCLRPLMKCLVDNIYVSITATSKLNGPLYSEWPSVFSCTAQGLAFWKSIYV